MNTARESPVPALARALVIFCLAAIPLRIVATGFLPGDDALRHAAKAVSGRPWSDILVLRPEITMDSHPGWHALLAAVHHVASADAPALVLFSILLLFLSVHIGPTLLMRRPEAWLLAWLIFVVAEPRLLVLQLLGRPFLLSESLLILLCLLLPRLPRGTLRGRWRLLGSLIALFGIAIWIHPVFFSFALPVAACLLARRFDLAGWLTVAIAAGLILASILSGQPISFIEQSALHVWLAFTTPGAPGTLVFEFSPWDGSPLFLAFMACFVLWRSLRRADRPALYREPLLLLAALGWVLGFAVMRFWSEWGLPAALVWLALEIEAELEQRSKATDPKRLAVVACAAIAAFLASSSNVSGRWQATPSPFAVLAKPELRGALPDPGGILYTDEIGLFFPLFYRLPQGPWRYIIGYEQALMPPDDLATFRKLHTQRSAENFAPWVRKMGPSDRLIIRSSEGRPEIPGLEWQPVSQLIWSGRKPALPQ